MSEANNILGVLEKYLVPFSGIFKGYFSLSQFSPPTALLPIPDCLDLSRNPPQPLPLFNSFRPVFQKAFITGFWLFITLLPKTCQVGFIVILSKKKNAIS